MANDPIAAPGSNNADVPVLPSESGLKPDHVLQDVDAKFSSSTDVRPGGDKPTTAAVNEAVEETTDAAKTLSSNANQLVRDGITKVSSQASDRARALVEDGRERAGTALDQLAQMLHEAAANVDERIGTQYGDYARSAADQVRGVAERVRAKDPDELFDEARSLIRQSPGAAIGVAAALGFGIARLVQSGLEASPAEPA